MTAYRIALVGNPNVGKSTLFNALTGGNQHVGNWHGKTVEKKEGWLTLNNHRVMVVDLPGTYSLSAYSIEEMIARDYLLENRDLTVVAVVDASNLERNLYLVCQTIELGVPLIIALNMQDTAQSRGVHIDTVALSQALGGIPIVATVGNRGEGMDALREAIADTSGIAPQSLLWSYEDSLESEITAIASLIAQEESLLAQYPSRWLAVKLLENDAHIREQLQAYPGLIARADTAIERITTAYEDDPETLMTDSRYQFIGQLVQKAVTREQNTHETTSDRLDRLMTHRFLGLPIFLLLMWTVFQLTANVSAPLVDWVDGVIGGIFAGWIQALLAGIGLAGSWVESLLIDGIIAGVGGVLVFVPLLALLYIAIAILEDSGYMARAAFVMDRVMRVIGLHGKSFLPLLIGFGCTVPAVYATRTLENERDRKLTAFIATFMSCGARLPVYVLFASVFFGAQSGNVIFGLYLLGIAIAILTGLAFKGFVYRTQEPQPFVMELPPYRMPNGRTVMSQTWERTRGFVRRASTLILATSVIVWGLMATPSSLNGAEFNAVSPEESLFGTVSGLFAPVFAMAGFDTWQASGALITGFIAKEVVVGTMSQIYEVDAVADETTAGLPPTVDLLADGQTLLTSFGEALVLTGQEVVNIVPRTVNILPFMQMPEADFLQQGDTEDDLSGLGLALSGAFTPLSAMAFMVFVLLYTPCITVVASMRQEFGWRWTLYQMLYTALIAWGMAVLVYQGGRLIGIGG